jgi:hypothetical protein
LTDPLTNLDLSDVVKCPQRDAPLYDLYAVSNHHGTFHGGHYTAHCKSRVDNEWHNYNDGNCSPVEEEEVKDNSSAYVLFYNRMVDDDGNGGGSGGNSDKRRSSDDSTSSLSHTASVRRQSISLPHLWPHLQSQPDLMKASSDTILSGGENNEKNNKDGLESTSAL